MLREQRQVATTTNLSVLFEEEPPPLEVFIRDKKYLNNPEQSLSPIQYDFVRHFEQIFLPDLYPDMVAEWGEYWSPVRYVNELAVEWGKGSGKDHCCQVAVARVANLLLCLRDPQGYYGLPHQAIIHTLNVAASSSQAHGVFFKPLRTLLTRSPWFADKFEGDVPGPQAISIRFRKQIELISGHSSSETLEGKNLIAAIADEISAFPTVAEVMANKAGRVPVKTAEGILDMLRSSATTRFPQSFKLAQISYPRFKGDAIQQAIAVGEEDIKEYGAESVYYISGPYATWNVNPRFEQFERVEVEGATEPVPNLASIVKDYRKNPAYARAKYECKPELSANRFFQNDKHIYAAFGDQRPDPITFEYYWGTDESFDATMRDETGRALPARPGWQVRFSFSPDLKPMAGAIYTLHGDMAVSGDKAGVAMCHTRSFVHGEWVRGEPQEGNYVMEPRPVVKVDFVTSFEADAAAPNAPREVQIRWYRKLVYELVARGFNVRYVSFDNFQSVDTIQILMAQGIESKRVSMDLNIAGWENLRDLMYDGRLEGYWRPGLIDEIRALTRLPNGKVDHPPMGSKDEADALAGAALGAVEWGGSEGDVPEEVDYGLDLFSVDVGKKGRSVGFGSMDLSLDGASSFGDLSF